MADPGDIIGQAVVNIRTCARDKCLTWDDEAESFRDANDYWDMDTRCSGCRGDGTYRAEEVATVEQRDTPFMVVGRDNPEGPSIVGRKDGWYPVEDGDTDE